MEGGFAMEPGLVLTQTGAKTPPFVSKNIFFETNRAIIAPVLVSDHKRAEFGGGPPSYV